LLTVQEQSLQAGLYVVATPIGTARDITLRALDILASADVLAAEDTRNTRKLMDIHGIALGGRPLVAYHDHNGAKQRPRLLGYIRDGKSVAYVSDAGTPLVADPGFALVRDAVAEGLAVTSAPGPSALLAALAVAGLPTDRFLFAGFLPPKTTARQTELRKLADIPATLVFFESGKRIGNCLSDMVHVLGSDRPAALCRELTKKFEEVRRGTLSELMDFYASDAPRGEIVLVVGPPVPHALDRQGVADMVMAARQTAGSLRDAVDQVTAASGWPRKAVYKLALEQEDS